MARAEMVMVREVLEGIVSPTVATSLIFEALEVSGEKPPRTLEEMRAFASGPLDSAIRKRVRPEEASEIRSLVGQLFTRAIEGDGVSVDVDVDVDVEPTDGNATQQMIVVKRPVPVVVLSASPTFADRLVTCLGEDRVRALSVTDEASVQKQAFAYEALLVVLDGVAPCEVDPGSLAGVLKRLPTSATPVVWAAETEWSAGVRDALDQAGVRYVTLERQEGIEPFLDLVLSRFTEE